MQKISQIGLFLGAFLLVACGSDNGNSVEMSSSSGLTLSSSGNGSSGTHSSAQSSLGVSSSAVASNAYGPAQVLIRAAGKSFRMGSDLVDLLAGIPDSADRAEFDFYIASEGVPEWPAHEVRLTEDFYMDESEVTQGQMEAAFSAVNSVWLDVLQTTWKNAREIAHVQSGERYPAIVTYPYLIALYANIRSALEGLTPVYELDSLSFTFRADFSANGYRLPTEAEWEYAARAESETDFYWGSVFTMPLAAQDSAKVSEYAVWKANSADLGIEDTRHGPHPVKSKKPNAYGLYDMAGNLSEYVYEHWSPEGYSGEMRVNPRDTTVFENDKDQMIKRGGNWMNGALFLRSACRTYGFSGYAEYGLGFRLVRKK